MHDVALMKVFGAGMIHCESIRHMATGMAVIATVHAGMSQRVVV
jgi:hypothetical protein